jgi:hypothetical protein
MNDLPSEVECSIDDCNGVGAKISDVLPREEYIAMSSLSFGYQGALLRVRIARVTCCAPICAPANDSMVWFQDNLEQLCNPPLRRSPNGRQRLKVGIGNHDLNVGWGSPSSRSTLGREELSSRQPKDNSTYKSIGGDLCEPRVWNCLALRTNLRI